MAVCVVCACVRVHVRVPCAAADTGRPEYRRMRPPSADEDDIHARAHYVILNVWRLRGVLDTKRAAASGLRTLARTHTTKQRFRARARANIAWPLRRRRQ